MRTFLLILFSTLPFFASLLYFLPTDPPPWFMIPMGLTKAFIFVAPFIFWKTLKLPGSWRDFPLLKGASRPRSWALGITIGALMSAVIYIGFHFILDAEVRSEALKRIGGKIEILGIREHYWIYGIVLSFVHSLLEEFYWRFFVFNAWKAKMPKGAPLLWAHLCAGFAFTLHHFSVTIHYFDLGLGLLLGLGVWVAGVVWSYTYEKERSFLAVWISHIIADLALISIGQLALSSI